MCRIFAVRSSQPISVKPAFDGLRALAAEHKDGWGVAIFEGCETTSGDACSPTVEKRVHSAQECRRFDELGHRAVQSIAVHIRLASVGTVHQRNNHPFLAKPWVFMHNGTLKNFEQHRADFEAQIAPEFRQFTGETDSERCFGLFRTFLGARTAFDDVVDALTRTFRTAERLCDDASPGKRSAMNFLVTDGARFFCTRRDRTLFYASSPTLAAIASERLPLEGAEWQEVPLDSMVTIDEALQLRVRPLAP
ncbi:MAG: class II glutamine amidotransferase [Myxococcota bacterium]